MQIHPALLEAVVRERERDLSRRRRGARARANGRPARSAASTRSVSIRLAGSDDAPDVRRLAALDAGSAEGLRIAEIVDSGRRPGVLLAEAEGALVAALELGEDRAYGDPFRPSAAAVTQLRERARHVGAGPGVRARRLATLAARLQPRRI